MRYILTTVVLMLVIAGGATASSQTKSVTRLCVFAERYGNPITRDDLKIAPIKGLSYRRYCIHGKKGKAGKNGAKGARGAQGATGAKGAVGPQGPPGATGLGNGTGYLCVSRGNSIKWGGFDGSLCNRGHDLLIKVVVVR
jgi:hypothetical protein